MASYHVFSSIRHPCSPNLDPENRGDALVTTSYAAPVAGAPRRGSCRCRTPSWPSAITFKTYKDGKGLRCSSHGRLVVLFPIHPFLGAAEDDRPKIKGLFWVVLVFGRA